MFLSYCKRTGLHTSWHMKVYDFFFVQHSADMNIQNYSFGIQIVNSYNIFRLLC
jgi:hypothetical protein